MKEQMNCQEELALGTQLAKDAGASETAKVLASDDYSPEKAIKTAMAEFKGNEDQLVAAICKGQPWWAYIALRFMPDLKSGRDALIEKATGDPKAAYYTLKDIAEVGAHRDALIKMACTDDGYASLTHDALPELGAYVPPVLDETEGAAPTQVGWGYNTYFVNLTGRPVWLMWNTGMAMSSGSISEAHLLKPGQNIGWGRGGACISGVNAWYSKPKDWATPTAGSWMPTPINGCNNWGFVLRANGNNVSIPKNEAVTWSYGQLGMPYKYPPSNGS